MRSMPPMLRNVVIVGASAAGLATAEALRNKGYDGSLTLVGDEPHLPYDRPPLSKQVLSGAWQPERVRLRDDEAIGRLDADFQLGRRATGLDLVRRKVLLDGGDRLAYDALVIATGVTPRRLPGDDLAGVHVLRTLDDALTLRSHLLARPKVVVVGAGFLGAEVAAVARTMGLEVTLVDPLPVPMRRQFGDRIGQFVGQLHSDHSVALRLGVGVARFLDSAGRVVAVELADGTKLDADLVVVAVGSTPATGWLADSGLPLGNGVECGARCQAAPGIYAAGDVASWHNPHFGVRMRVEHRLNATEQGMAVAAGILGEQRPFAPVPYFWSDQYDARIQAYGIFPDGADVTIVHGSPDDRSFVAAYGHEGKVVGVLGWNSHRELRKHRQLVVDHAPHPAMRTPEGEQ
ncbi:NAD(P)/FAD-dependent oxidoreductase [Streptomyces milbemycinicus]|uniref:NAD(P)/FAD-dependent oxidoreductase n=1 Tax=Streptomyces milbemycinicus TaxID=476552 RepID=UPI0033C5F2B4